MRTPQNPPSACDEMLTTGIVKIKNWLEGEEAIVKMCEEKGTGVLHTSVMAKHTADTLRRALKILGHL